MRVRTSARRNLAGKECLRLIDRLAPRPQSRTTQRAFRRTTVLWTIFVILVVLWALGFAIHVGGGLIHLLLVVAVVVLVVQLITGRRAI